MKQRILVSIFFISIGTMLFSQTYNIEIKIPNIDKIEGQILIAVYNSGDTFLVQKEAFKVYAEDVKEKTMSFTFNDFPKGEYSIALFHDEDSNGKMKRNFLGIPSEDYGFSNITSMLFSRPSYEDTRFYLESDTSFVVELQ